MLELALATVIGVIAGVITGSIPGLHPNTIIFSSLPIYFSSEVSFPVYVCLISGISVSHTFNDFLPAIYLSAPSSESALASIPGTEMAQRGEGKKAFYFTLTGGLMAVFLFIVILPGLFLLLDPIYRFASVLMPFILVFFLLFILFQKLSFEAFKIGFLSSLLGILAFRMPVNQNFVLMPVFTGLFAVPAILEAYRSDIDIPEQKELEKEFSEKGGLIGFVSGLIAGIIPGVGAGTATSFLSPLIDDRKEVLTGFGAVNTTDIFVSLIALYVIEKARSGASVAIQTLGTMDSRILVIATASSLFAAGMAYPLALRSHDVFVKIVKAFQLEKVLLLVLLIVTGLTFLLAGFQGLLILLTSSLIGLMAWRNGCRMVTMSVLIMPALLFYLGVGIFI